MTAKIDEYDEMIILSARKLMIYKFYYYSLRNGYSFPVIMRLPVKLRMTLKTLYFKILNSYLILLLFKSFKNCLNLLVLYFARPDFVTTIFPSGETT